MSTLALFLTLIFVAFAILLSAWQRLGLEKDIIIGTVRAAVQLIAVGYVLHTIFELKSWTLIILMLSIMITVATLNARKKGKGFAGYWLPNCSCDLVNRNFNNGFISQLENH